MRIAALSFAALLVLPSSPRAHDGAPSAASTSTPSLHALPFGPFESGPERPVTRQGTPGKARRPHPVVGAVGHIPGAGPPPPALRTDPYLPELATKAPNAAPGLSSNPLNLAALFYANFLTRTDGPRCQHLPTCSRFASQAVAKHGLLGIPLGLDRVIQPPQSSALRPLPDVMYGEMVRHWDPVDNYEFWKPENFTGLPPLVPEEPLVFTPVPGDDAPVPVSP